jgi:predicted AAA+ superfamily ATPase
MIHRQRYLERLSKAIKRSPVTALLGPRQCGKTTLAKEFTKGKSAHFFDLESPQDRARLQNAMLVLASLEGIVIIDEIQAMPELFPLLRVLADDPESKARFLILGSVSFQIVRNVSETLAGRVEFIEMAGFDISELAARQSEKHWIRGSFPRSFLAGSDEDSVAWREGFIKTFLERDIPQLGISIPAVAMRRFWMMLAHYHGQTWNASEIARAMGLSDKTVRSYLDILTGTFMMRQLQPWHENIAKRQVKAPKIYFRDTGLLHHLLGLTNMHSLLGHPRVGASWEGFAIEQILQIIRPSEAFFWGTHTGSEIDLFLIHEGKRYGFEVKFTESPAVTKSMQLALDDLKLEHLWIIHPGKHAYPVHKKITALPLHAYKNIGFLKSQKK